MALPRSERTRSKGPPFRGLEFIEAVAEQRRGRPVLPGGMLRVVNRVPVAMTIFVARRPSAEQLRDAEWVARCVGRADLLPLDEPEVESLAASLDHRVFQRGEVLFRAGKRPSGIWIVREGVVELAVGHPRRRSVVMLLHAGDVEGDVPLVLGTSAAYDARALTDGSCLYLDRLSFERLLAEHPVIAHRWLANCMQRLERSHERIVQLLGASVQEQVALLLLDEAVDGAVRLPQQTLAAMLGVQRQSLNKALKELEHLGLLDVGYADVQVRDERRLRQLSNSHRR